MAVIEEYKQIEAERDSLRLLDVERGEELKRPDVPRRGRALSGIE